MLRRFLRLFPKRLAWPAVETVGFGFVVFAAGRVSITLGLLALGVALLIIANANDGSPRP